MGVPGAPRTASLGQQVAFDLMSARLAWRDPSDKPLLVVASSLMTVQSALMRLRGPVDFALETPVTVEEARVLVDALPVRQMADVEFLRADDISMRPPGVYRGAIWASPHPSNWRSRLPLLQAAVSDGGLLAVLTQGWLGALLAPLRRQSKVDEPRWLRSDLQAELEQLGFKQDQTYDFCRLGCAAYGVLSRLATMIRRPDLADRAEVAYRQLLLDPQGPGPAAFSLLAVRKPGHGG